MDSTVPPTPFAMPLAKQGGALVHWLRAHRGAIAVAGLLAFAGPLTFFTGALSVMRAPTAANVGWLGLWWTLFGLTLWGLLLMAGHGCERLAPRLVPPLRGTVWLLAAIAVAVAASVLTVGRATILLEQGLVHSERTMHLNGITISLVMALLYFAHLRRSREHEQAAARLAAAQAAQRQARRRIAQARLQEVQARIDPQLLFEMLGALRLMYEHDVARAEQFLDELIGLLRAALPRLRAPTSSLPREAELAHACVRLHALAGARNAGMRIDIDAGARHARFPPGVLLPLVGSAAVIAGPCQLAATRTDRLCRVRLTLAALPAEASIAQVRALLSELYGAAASLRVERAAGTASLIVEVPYELA